MNFLAAPSPTNLVGLHRIQEEHQRNPLSYPNPTKSPSPSSVVLINGDDEQHAMDCDVQINAHAPYPTPDDLFRAPFCQAPPASFFYNTSSLLAQQLAIPTTSTTSSFMPWSDEDCVNILFSIEFVFNVCLCFIAGDLFFFSLIVNCIIFKLFRYFSFTRIVLSFFILVFSFSFSQREKSTNIICR